MSPDAYCRQKAAAPGSSAYYAFLFLARERYARALESLPHEDRHAQRPGLILAAIDRALLEEIERDGFRVLEHRMSLTPLRKFWIAWTTWVPG